MGILVQDNGQRSKLQDRITADLREKAQRTSRMENDKVDLVEDSEYAKHLKKTGRFSWFWFVLIFLAVIALIVIFVLK
ncbi:MAG: hypothetical protein LBT19_02890 [Candidatus Nomurabacteria bacterium]|nr:hypothetical protein [Candidatus Nomurabacteria bacterium]